jgi:hypothetical protein
MPAGHSADHIEARLCTNVRSLTDLQHQKGLGRKSSEQIIRKAPVALRQLRNCVMIFLICKRFLRTPDGAI